jgi:hypothetical protein
VSPKFVGELPGGASRLAALLLPHIFPICSVVAPCQPGAALRDFGNGLLIRDTRITTIRYRATLSIHGKWLAADSALSEVPHVDLRVLRTAIKSATVRPEHGTLLIDVDISL